MRDASSVVRNLQVLATITQFHAIVKIAYLIWKMRNERRIRDNDGPDGATEQEIDNRWTNAINRRLTIDRTLTDERRFRRKAMDEKTVKATWSGCLKNEDYLPQSWPADKGVLVGISPVCPPGHTRRDDSLGRR